MWREEITPTFENKNKSKVCQIYIIYVFHCWFENITQETESWKIALDAPLDFARKFYVCLDSDTDQIKIQIKFKKQTVTKISFSLTTEKNI